MHENFVLLSVHQTAHRNEKITHNGKKFEAQMSGCGSLRIYTEELFLREEKIKTNSFLMDKRLEHVLHRKGKSHGQGTQAKTQTSLAPKEMQIAITRFSKMRGSVRASGCQGRGDGPFRCCLQFRRPEAWQVCPAWTQLISCRVISVNECLPPIRRPRRTWEVCTAMLFSSVV